MWGSSTVWLQWDVVTSNDVKELKGRLSPLCVGMCIVCIMCLRAKWEFGTCALTAGTETPTHVKLYKDNTRTGIRRGAFPVCMYMCVCTPVCLSL